MGSLKPLQYKIKYQIFLYEIFTPFIVVNAYHHISDQLDLQQDEKYSNHDNGYMVRVMGLQPVQFITPLVTVLLSLGQLA